MRRFLLLLLTAAGLVWPIVLLASDYQASSTTLTMPYAITIVASLATIMVAVIKFGPARQMPVNITITWPEKIPEHYHPEYMTRAECERVHDALGHELRDVKGTRG